MRDRVRRVRAAKLLSVQNPFVLLSGYDLGSPEVADSVYDLDLQLGGLRAGHEVNPFAQVLRDLRWRAHINGLARPPHTTTPASVKRWISPWSSWSRSPNT